ncbi:MAG TPA: pyridoxal-phosphate dependent enzyme [Streptosporangiaceae bacterium]|jgi:diaminopropionate ammonia-lyase
MTAWYVAPDARSWTAPAAGPSGPGGARAFHQSLPGYEPTPLVSRPELATELGVGRVLVKDESSRLGLPAFKVLGASWACHQVLARRPGARLVTGTDGNHGRAVARMAAHFGVRATVFVPTAMLPRTAALIESEGAEVVRIDGDYDEAVRAAAALAAAQPDHALVQDTAWPGYEQVPAWIVAGYQTLLEEIDDQLDQTPGLVVTPVGVGSLAQAVVTHYRQPGRPHPAVLAVEPDSAAGLLASLQAGEPVAVPTANTVMAGLNCGTVSAAAWPVLRQGNDAAVAVTDQAALAAVADLGRLGVSSGPSGAATLAGARAALTRPERRAALGLSADAAVVLLSTEGNAPGDN